MSCILMRCGQMSDIFTTSPVSFRSSGEDTHLQLVIKALFFPCQGSHTCEDEQMNEWVEVTHFILDIYTTFGELNP